MSSTQHQQPDRKRHSRNSPEPPSKRDEEETTDRKAHKSHRERHGHSRDGDSSHGRHRKRHRSATPDKALVIYDKPRPNDASDNNESLFVVDKRGDPLVLRYGSNDRSKVPGYRRYGFGTVLGSREPLTISRDGAREEFFSRSYRDAGSVFRDRHSSLLKASRSKGRTVKQRPEAPEGPRETDEFVPLSTKKRRLDEDRSGSSDDEKELSYRSILRKTKNTASSDDDLGDSDSSAYVDAVSLSKDPIKVRSIELSRRVKESPDDLDSWLALIDLQDDLFAGENGGRDPTADEIKGLADMKASLLESALAHAASEPDREKLLVMLMREGLKTWTPAQLAKRWQEMARDNINSFELWKCFLDFELTNLSTFSLERLKNVCIQRLRLLRGRLSGASSSVETDVLLGKQLIYVFLRTTCVLRDAGFMELALAAWQALLELTFARPDNLDRASADAIMVEMRDFWESEVTRIGEDGAKGWRHFSQATEMEEAPEAKNPEPVPSPTTRDAYKAWAATEQHRVSVSHMPGRTLDEGNDDDPFRVVMFSDIEEMLFVIPASVVEVLKPHLVDSMLLFCGLPPAARPTDDWIRAAQNDAFILSVGGALEESRGPDHSSELQESSRKVPQFVQDASRTLACLEGFFGDSKWFSYWPASLRASDNPRQSWVLNVAKQLVRTFGFEDLAESSLSMEWTRRPEAVKKAARGLLKLYPARWPLYEAYAMAEHANGNEDVAQKVLLSATGQDLSSNPQAALSFWHTWAWMEFETGNKDRAVARLCSATEDAQAGSRPLEETSPSGILKARQKLHSSRDYQLSAGDTARACAYAQSFALLEYLTASGGAEPASASQGNISAAMDSIHAFSSDLSSRDLNASPAHERLLQFASHLLYLHAVSGYVVTLAEPSTLEPLLPFHMSGILFFFGGS